MGAQRQASAAAPSATCAAAHATVRATTAQQRAGKVCTQHRKARGSTVDGKPEDVAAAVGSGDGNDKGDKAEHRGPLAAGSKEADAPETVAAEAHGR